jgi:curved DNA-binding protein CbpA
VNLYDILELRPEAKDEEIRRSFRRLALRFHPDASGNPDSARFRAIQHAYEILSDPRKRAEYDNALKETVPVRVIRDRWPDTEVEPLIPPFASHSQGRVRSFPRYARYSYEREEQPIEDLLRFVEFFWRRF